MEKKLYITAYDEVEWPMETMYYATQNPESKNVIVVEGEALVWLLNTRFMHDIDRENDSEIHLGEDDWLPITSTKAACVEILKKEMFITNDTQNLHLIERLLELFKKSIEDESLAVCFLFQ